jgi:hypothetical protein
MTPRDEADAAEAVWEWLAAAALWLLVPALGWLLAALAMALVSGRLP